MTNKFIIAYLLFADHQKDDFDALVKNKAVNHTVQVKKVLLKRNEEV